MITWIVLFVVLAAVALAMPFLGGRARTSSRTGKETAAGDQESEPDAVSSIQQLDLDLAAGKLSAEDHRGLIAEWTERRGRITGGGNDGVS
ncbi:MAG: hypothetical protein JSV26_00865 [bacterium]|nr:MAG: hypothetical protein JSV26_00865 [bacterium]